MDGWKSPVEPGHEYPGRVSRPDVGLGRQDEERIDFSDKTQLSWKRRAVVAPVRRHHLATAFGRDDLTPVAPMARMPAHLKPCQSLETDFRRAVGQVPNIKSGAKCICTQRERVGLHWFQSPGFRS